MNNYSKWKRIMSKVTLTLTLTTQLITPTALYAHATEQEASADSASTDQKAEQTTDDLNEQKPESSQSTDSVDAANDEASEDSSQSTEDAGDEDALDETGDQRPYREQVRELIKELSQRTPDLTDVPDASAVDRWFDQFPELSLREQMEGIHRFLLYSDDEGTLFSNYPSLTFDHLGADVQQPVIELTALIREINMEDEPSLSEAEIDAAEREYLRQVIRPYSASVGRGLTPVRRIADTNRFTTATLISREGWNRADTVIIANSQAFPDIIAASPLAALEKAPILYTERNYLHSATAKELRRLRPKKVIILGGHLSIAPAVENQLRKDGYPLSRISGATRYDVAKKIGDHVQSRTKATEAILINGEAFSDGVSISSYAAQSGLPIYLTKTHQLHNTVRQGARKFNRWTVVGGHLSVSNKTYNQLQTASGNRATRISGRNRYEVNRTILKKFNYNKKTTYVADGEFYTDPVAASSLASLSNNPVLLVNSSQARNVARFANQQNLRHLTIVGGVLSVSTRTEKILQRSNYNGQYASVFLDAGHGGSEYGAVYGIYKEKDLNLAVTNFIYQALQQDPRYDVYMTRTGDTYHSLANRSQRANRQGTDIFVSVHHNSIGGALAGKARGIETFIQTPSYTSTPQSSTNQPESLKLARAVHPKVIAASGLIDRGIRGQNLHVNRETKMPSILIEYGFMNNSQEIKILTLRRYQQAVGVATKEGIDSYFGF